MATSKDIIPGEKFHRLTVICEAARFPGNHNRRVTAQCECGTVKDYFISHLRHGKSKSCGCWRKDSPTDNAKHGHAGKRTRIYVIWKNMVQRCCNPKSDKYEYYGGRGIKVCDRWKIFENFLSDMGCPAGRLSLDRHPNVNGDYEPNNCRWATNKEQANNKRNNRLIEFNGEIMTMAQWSNATGISYGTLKRRLNSNNWTIERALTMPIRLMRRS